MRVPATRGRAKARPAGKIIVPVTRSVYFSIQKESLPATPVQSLPDFRVHRKLCTAQNAVQSDAPLMREVQPGGYPTLPAWP